jgi:hypothetical protein
MDGTPSLTDREYARRFERGEVSAASFHHREHLRLAWAYLQESDSTDEACARMRGAIRAFAQAAGHPEKYHETLTVLWVRLLAAVRAQVDDAADVDDVLPAHPWLLDKDTPHTYYSRARLTSDEARRVALEPDIAPVPGHLPCGSC